MSSSCDRTGFPFLTLRSCSVAVQMLPVTKVQWERYLAASHSFGDAWYEQLLRVNPRCSYTQFQPPDICRLFATGILAEEALAFASWLGPGWTLPSVELWRRMYGVLSGIEVNRAFLQSIPEQQFSRAALATVRGLIRHRQPKNLVDLTLFSGGVVEWVREDGAWAGLGQPPPELGGILRDPLAGPPVRPLKPQSRLAYFGFRLVRPFNTGPQPAAEQAGMKIGW